MTCSLVFSTQRYFDVSMAGVLARALEEFA